jgi:hypothetical protein
MIVILPFDVNKVLFGDWVSLVELANFDTSICNSFNRKEFLELISNKHFTFHSNEGCDRADALMWISHKQIKMMALYVCWSHDLELLLNLNFTCLNSLSIGCPQNNKSIVRINETELIGFINSCPHLKTVSVITYNRLQLNSVFSKLSQSFLNQLVKFEVINEFFHDRIVLPSLVEKNPSFNVLKVDLLSYNHSPFDCSCEIISRIPKLIIENNNELNSTILKYPTVQYIYIKECKMPLELSVITKAICKLKKTLKYFQIYRIGQQRHRSLLTADFDFEYSANNSYNSNKQSIKINYITTKQMFKMNEKDLMDFFTQIKSFDEIKLTNVTLFNNEILNTMIVNSPLCVDRQFNNCGTNFDINVAENWTVEETLM